MGELPANRPEEVSGEQTELSMVRAAESQGGQEWERIEEVTKRIAEDLEERDFAPRQGIKRSVRVLGIETALVLLEKTQEVEAAGGMPVVDGSRRRTPGGVYFALVRAQATDEQRVEIFPPVKWQTTKKKKKLKNASSASKPGAGGQTKGQASVPAVLWSERGAWSEEAEQQRGEARTVKVTLIGRPSKVVERGQCVACVLQQGAKIPSLPAGLPLPPVEEAQATRYSVYIALKQWKKVAEAMRDEEDVLIIEGWQMLDAQRGTIAVFASNVTTKKLQGAARQAKG